MVDWRKLPPIPIPCGHVGAFSSGCMLCNTTLNSNDYRARFGIEPMPLRHEPYLEVDELSGTIPIPCGHPTHSSGCHHCELAARDERYAKLFNREFRPQGPPQEPVLANPKQKHALSVIRDLCVHQGKRLEDSPSCGCGSLYACGVHGTCRKTNPGPTGSKTCLNCDERKTRDQERPNPKAGVVLGTYGYPNLVALQIHLIRKHNPNIPILITDDNSDGTTMTPMPDTNFGKICEISRKYENVIVWSNPQRMGHAGGDLTTYFVGLQWAKALNLDALFKLSFRFIFDKPNWVQEWLDEWWPTGWATSSRKCREGASVFEIRSECMGMDVKKWATPAILDHIRPRPLSIVEGKWGVAAENVLWDSIRDRLEGNIHMTRLFGEDRFVKDKDIIWHCSAGPDVYQQIFEREGFQMDEGFTNQGWVHQKGYQG